MFLSDWNYDSNENWKSKLHSVCKFVEIRGKVARGSNQFSLQ